MPTKGFGAGGLAIDEKRRLLWVSSPAMPEVAGFNASQAGQSQLVAFSLQDGAVMQTIDLPMESDVPHTVVDLTVANDGTVYAADSTSPIVWEIKPRAIVATKFATIERPGTRHSLQGTVITPDGQWLIVADYSTGLHRISRIDGTVEMIELNEPVIGTALGIDGIALRGETLLAVQNGVQPARLIAFTLDQTSDPDRRPLLHNARVVASGHDAVTDPTLIAVTNDGFAVVGNAGWKYFGTNAEPNEENRMVPIVHIMP